MDQSNIQIGEIYRHYKGMLYRVHQIVRHSETLEELVYYEALYENPLGVYWVRPLKMFTESVNISGEAMQRFQRIE